MSLTELGHTPHIHQSLFKPQGKHTRLQEVVQDFAMLLLDEMKSNDPISEIAQRRGLDSRSLAYEFKKLYGLPPKQWLLQERIKRARDILIKASHKPCLKSLSSELGFSSPSRFGVYYRKTYGETPRYTLRLRQAILKKES